MKKILIMGAGVYQVPLIRTARAFGLYTIVVSIPGNYPGFALADKVYYVDTTDKESVLEIARKEKISGICTSGTDVAVATIGYINQELNLSGVSEEAASRTADKAVMQEMFKRGNVASAQHRVVSTSEEAIAAAGEIGYPVVVKCVDSSGSRGINIVEHEEEVEAAFEDALKYSRKPHVLVEERLPGREIGIDGIVSNGKLIFVSPHRKKVYLSGQTMITAGHDLPYEAKDPEQREIHRQTEAAVQALGLDDCAVNLDAFVDGEKVYIIEIGARSGATCIPELISRCYGFDYYEAIIDLALGRTPKAAPSRNSVACKARLIMSPVDGVLTGIDREGIDAIRKEGIHVSFDYEEGARIERMRNGTDRIGQVIASVSEEEEMDAVLNRVYRCIRIDHHLLEELWGE